jgi:hypothetical protein
MPLHQSVRDALPVRLGNRKYNIDITQLQRSTIDPIRQGMDTGGTPGEQSLNQAGVWKRSRDDWELGAGQIDADTPESVLRQFEWSDGIDPWTKDELKLHKAVGRSSNSRDNLFLATMRTSTEPDVLVSGYGNSLIYTRTGFTVDTGGTWVIGASAVSAYFSDAGGEGLINEGDILAMASNGDNVFFISNAAIYKVSAVSGSSYDYPQVTARMAGASLDGIYVANGYLIVTQDGGMSTVDFNASAKNIITTTAFDQITGWTSIIGTQVGIYAAGNSGNRGRIYYLGINDSTSDLDVPVIAAELPEGETVNVIAEEFGYVIIGTNKGIRIAQISGEGFLSYGPRIDIKNADGKFVGTQTLEPQGEFIWFGWEGMSGTSTGLGRISFQEFTAPMVPAFACDLCYKGVTGPVRSIVTFTNSDGVEKRIYSIDGEGFFVESLTDYVTTGSLGEGKFRYGVTELKTAVSADMRHGPLNEGESIVLSLTDDEGNTETSDSDPSIGPTTSTYLAGVDYAQVTPGIKPVGGIKGEYIVPTVTLNRGTDATKTPTLQRWTVRAIPMPFVAEVIQLPVILTTYTTHDNREVYQDIYEDYTYIRELLENRELVTFIMGNETKNVYVAGIAYQQGSISKWSDSEQRKENRRDRWLEGVLTVQLITVQTGVTLRPTEQSSTG